MTRRMWRKNVLMDADMRRISPHASRSRRSGRPHPRSWVAALLAVASTAACTILSPACSFAQQPTESQVQNQIDKAKNARADARNRVAALKQKVQQLHAQENTINGKLANIEVRMTRTQQQINGTVIRIQERDREITQTQQQVAVAKARLQVQNQVLTNRLRVMYEAGHTNYLAVLFSASSFSDLLSRFHLLTLVAQRDKELFVSIQTRQRQLQHQQTQLNAMLEAQKQAYALLLHTQSLQSAQQQEEQHLFGQVHSQAAQASVDLTNETNALSDLGTKISELEKQLGAYHSNHPTGPWDWPVPGYTTISSGYGWRQLNGAPNFHPGIDIAAPIGTRIVAATDGKVLFAGPADGYGDWIVIESDNGLLEIYGHMYPNELEVSPGQVVQKGQEIARVGDNGFSTGPHLHFEVATGIGSDGIPTSTDPTPYVGR